MSEKTKNLVETLERGLCDYIQSDKYKDILRIMSKFHSYSFNNTMLILLQCPQASYIAGYKSWQTNFHRQVKKGSKAIHIIAPVKYKAKNEETGEEEERTGFKTTSVFDISDTYQIPDLEPIPIGIEDLEGNVENFKDFISALEKISPVPVSYEIFDDKALKGCYSDTEKKITIQDGMTERQTVKTLIHEAAHAMLHTKEQLQAEKKDRKQRELEAESVAFIVCDHFHISTEDYSFPYIMSWTGERFQELLKSSMNTIQKTSNTIINGIRESLIPSVTKTES